MMFAGKMIRLFKVKEKQRELAENNNGKTPVKKQSAGELRLHKGLPNCTYPSIKYSVWFVSTNFFSECIIKCSNCLD